MSHCKSRSLYGFLLGEPYCLLFSSGFDWGRLFSQDIQWAAMFIPEQTTLLSIQDAYFFRTLPVVEMTRMNKKGNIFEKHLSPICDVTKSIQKYFEFSITRLKKQNQIPFKDVAKSQDCRKFIFHCTWPSCQCPCPIRTLTKNLCDREKAHFNFQSPSLYFGVWLTRWETIKEKTFFIIRSLSSLCFSRHVMCSYVFFSVRF